MAEERKDPALCPNRQLDPYKVRAGYYNAEREYEYWVPQGDIVGEIPRSLHGTLYRNGPGLMEVYGTKLVHRESTAHASTVSVTESYIIVGMAASLLSSLLSSFSY